MPYPSGIVACSRLDTVVTSTPVDLHSRFRHLGVWNLDQIARTGNGGHAQALLFGNTEVFVRPVGVKRLHELGEAFGGFVIPQQPQVVPGQFFAEIYREGRNNG